MTSSIALMRSWYRVAGNLSSPTRMMELPEFEELVKRGKEVVPFIVNEYRKNSGYWFLFLSAIYGYDPVPKEHCGDARKTRAIWLKWYDDLPSRP